ncbi:NADP-dependent oxidoreductase [Nocardia sp. CDC160]|uniref:NADP-dependent oxidoreductase n=1 Tax=Nocardia sp. CDC160 TaxID=3112166 RepID=UPI002DB8349F|nr:NADP-dependent oxidoreductase [Nocardia sp. CDC160]MEC3917718.1 NADP-dependent oxidoreductase [Nocardia sp. CDC160]
MRAVGFSRFGGPEVLEVFEVTVPEPEADEVLVKIVAAPVNPVDIGARAGAFAALLPQREHYVPGVEFAGYIEEVGKHTSRREIGQPVIGLLPWLETFEGSYAEYVRVPADLVAAAPSGVDLTAAATLPLNGITADLAVSQAGAAPGRTVLITGAAGGVGGYAVQLATARGARVIAVAGPGDDELIRSLGASEFLTRGDDLTQRLGAGRVDAVIDAALIGAALLPVVREGGAFVALLPPVAPPPQRGITVTTVQQAPDGARLAELVDLVEAGTLSLRVAETYPLEKAADAHARFERGGLRGRLVLIP